MATKTKSQKNSGSKSNAKASSGGRNNGATPNGRPAAKAPAVRVNQYGIPDWRLEQPEFEVREVTSGPEVHYVPRSQKLCPLSSTTVSIVLMVTLATPNLVLASDPKKDPDQIGNRDVGKGVNFYSLEKEIALGKGLAQEVEKQAKIINDPVIA